MSPDIAVIMFIIDAQFIIDATHNTLKRNSLSLNTRFLPIFIAM